MDIMDTTPPKVFISYSHDSQDHKDWVRSFAQRLKANGVNVILDQWDIRLGQDITIFMERNLQESNRVLIICTEQYLEKAKNLKGGVGYERMIVTSEIAGDLNTNKFIPVLRSGNTELMPSYLASRKYVDFRVAALFDEKLTELLHELHDVPKFPVPPLGKKPFPATILEASTGKSVGTIPEKYHWHRAVHEYCGSSLYFIFIRFLKDSIFFRESILKNLQSSNITDYMILHLYSNWDILIRVWADKDSFETLRNHLEENVDLHPDKVFLTVSDLVHLRDNYRTSQDVILYLTSTSIERLEDIQQKWQASSYFSTAYENGLILEDSIRFNNSRIQFYITVKRDKQFSAHLIARLCDFLRSKQYIENKSVYRTTGSAIVVLIKGQIKPDDYYAVYTFLQEIAEHLKGEEVETETVFVAQPEPRSSANIDFERAKIAIGCRIFKERFPGAKELRLLDQRKLEDLFLEVWDKLDIDTFGVFDNLFEIKIGASKKNMADHFKFFSTFEKLLNSRLPNIIMESYSTHEWQKILDDMKREESISRENYKLMNLGELAKIYRRIVLDKSVIEINPLSGVEFARYMDEYLPKMRNDLGHRPDLAQWEAVFAFWSRFIEVYTRLRTKLEAM